MNHPEIDLALCAYMKRCAPIAAATQALAEPMENYAFLCIYASRRNALISAFSELGKMILVLSWRVRG